MDCPLQMTAGYPGAPTPNASAANQFLLDLQKAAFQQQQPQQPGAVQVQAWSGALASAAKSNAYCYPQPFPGVNPPIAAPPRNSTMISSTYFNQQHTAAPAPATQHISPVAVEARSAALDAVASVMGESFASSLSHLPPGALELLCSGGVVQEQAMGYQATCNIQPVGIKVSTLPFSSLINRQWRRGHVSHVVMRSSPFLLQFCTGRHLSPAPIGGGQRACLLSLHVAANLLLIR
jgi:hypothetical protein